jgi:hypothetical protein
LALTAATSLVAVGSATSRARAATLGDLRYEADCTTPVQPGLVLPFVETIHATASPDPRFPTGQTFAATGTVSINVLGSFIAGLEANGVDRGSFSVDVTVGASANATGAYHLSATAPSVTWNGRRINAVDTDGLTNVVTSANFVATDVGHIINGTGIPANTMIVSVVPGVSATLSTATTAAGTIAHAGTGPALGVDYSVPLNTGPAFTTAGNVGQVATLNLTGTDGFELQTPTIDLGFGATFGGQCTQTGYTAAHVVGPHQLPAVAPLLPDGTVDPLRDVAPLVTADFAQITLDDLPPFAVPQFVPLQVGATRSVTLGTIDDATPARWYEIVSPPSDPRLTATVIDPATGVTTVTDSGADPATVTFTYHSCDQQSPSGTVPAPPGVHCGAPATVTVGVGSPIPLSGQLVLSCTPPDAYLAPPLGAGADDPQLLCPGVVLAPITLNGLEQTTTTPGETLFVTDGRGDPTVGWTLSAQMVETPTGSAPGENPNVNCAHVAGFCNADVGSHALEPNGRIASDRLTVHDIACAPHPGNPSPSALPGGGGSLASTQVLCVAAPKQGYGTFDVTRTYSLTVPSSVFVGQYHATVEYTLS